MNTLVLFNRPVVVPDDNNEKLEIYGFVADKEKWKRCPFKTDYIYYVLVIAELFKEGIITKFGYDFEKDGTPFSYRDPIWNDYELDVIQSDIEYAVVEEVELDENDFFETHLTSRKRWLELVEKGGLKWV